MKAPPGLISLREATNLLGRKMFGHTWDDLPIADQSAIVDRANSHFLRLAPEEAAPLAPAAEAAMARLVEHCATGKIATWYRSRLGADLLDPAVWRGPHWRAYFENGMITLELPLLDNNLQPIKGTLTRQDREIFVSSADLARLINETPQRRGKTIPSKHVTPKLVDDAWAAFLRSGIKRTMNNFADFGRINFGITDRDALRSKYSKASGNPGRGRRRK